MYTAWWDSRSNTGESGSFLCIAIFARFPLKGSVQVNNCKDTRSPFVPYWRAQAYIQTHHKFGPEVFWFLLKRRTHTHRHPLVLWTLAARQAQTGNERESPLRKELPLNITKSNFLSSCEAAFLFPVPLTLSVPKETPEQGWECMAEPRQRGWVYSSLSLQSSEGSPVSTLQLGFSEEPASATQRL